LTPLRKICRTNDGSVRRSRTRRAFPVAGAIIGVAAFTGIILLAGTLTSSIFTSINGNKIAELQSDYNILREENKAFKEALKTLTTNQISIIERLTELENQVDQLKMELPEIAMKVSDASSRFTMAKITLNEVVADWRSGRIGHAFVDQFLPKLPPDSILSMSETLECILYEDEDHIEFTYNIPVRNRLLSVYEANSFDVYKNYSTPQNNTATCRIVYEGPQFAINHPDCVYELHSRTNWRSTAFVFPLGMTCPSVTEEQQQKYWKVINCEDSKSIPGQVKHTNQGDFIFCSGLKIHIDNLDMDCPYFVFQVPKDISYRIGDGDSAYHYNPKAVITPSSNFSVVEDLRISHYLYPKGRIQDYNRVRGLKEQLDILDSLHEPPPIFTGSWVMYGSPGVLFAFLGLTAGFYYLFCRRTSGNEDGSVTVVNKFDETRQPRREPPLKPRRQEQHQLDQIELEELIHPVYPTMHPLNNFGTYSQRKSDPSAPLNTKDI